jgi:hypothetical protein
MDNVGIVVESLDAAISFFAELGLELEGRAMIEGDWSGRWVERTHRRVVLLGLPDERSESSMGIRVNHRSMLRGQSLSAVPLDGQRLHPSPEIS